MSPEKKKKLTAALDNLFSSARKPVQPIEKKAVVTTVDIPLQEPPTIAPAVELEAPSISVVPQKKPVEAGVTKSETPVLIENTTTAAVVKPGKKIQPETESPVPELADAKKSVKTGQEDQQLVVFSLAGELFGLDIALVESIIKMQPITELPQTPSYIIGVTNLRGSVLPVIDLRTRFALASQPETRDTRIIIVAMDHIKVGMVVDGVSEVLRVPGEAIEALSPMVNSVNSAFLKGIARMENHLIILLEISKVLNINEK
jgi:purine-binding chemotaxis protein CheW